jgi:hypothetical protein
VRREPKTNEDLDKELEAFMKSPDSAEKVSAVFSSTMSYQRIVKAKCRFCSCSFVQPAQATAPEGESGGDVEMS